MRVIRAIVGAIGGYLVFAITGVLLGVLSGRNLHAEQPFWFVAVTVVYGMLFAALGGIVASRIAPYRSWAAAGMMGLLALGAALSLVMSPEADARWSQWAALLFMAPSAIIGPALAPRFLRPARTD